MKLLTANQIREWDQYTIQHEPISSLDLMERAASTCIPEITKCIDQYRPECIAVCCGTGNNGGDGLVIARLLSLQHTQVQVYILDTGSTYAADFTTNLNRLGPISVQYISQAEAFPILKHTLIIDALFGTGLNKPVNGNRSSIYSAFESIRTTHCSN